MDVSRSEIVVVPLSMMVGVSVTMVVIVVMMPMRMSATQQQRAGDVHRQTDTGDPRSRSKSHGDRLEQAQDGLDADPE